MGQAGSGPLGPGRTPSTARATPVSRHRLPFMCPRQARQGQAVLGYHAPMFKLGGKSILPSPSHWPAFLRPGLGFGYQAATALEGTHPASWQESEAADGSFSSAAIKQVPTGDFG